MNVVLDRRCRIECPAKTKDPIHGSAVTTWSLKAVVWCNVQDVLPGRSEAIKNGLAVSSNQSRFRCRYMKGLDSSMRIIIGDIKYQIISGPAVIGSNEYLEMMIERYTTA